MNKIPVTILSGFLGAGKTTLLNQIIADHPNQKIVVIENEFGQIGIDNALVVGVDAKVFELSNGCICCNLNDELLEVLSQLIRNEVPISHLIIETTGMADPGPVALNFIADENIQQYFSLNAIITLVDAQFIEQQLENQEEAVKQIALADLILVNKTDCVEQYQLDVVKNIVAKINDQAKVYFTSYGRLADLDLLHLNTFAPETILRSSFAIQKKHNSTGHFSLSNQPIESASLLLTKPRHQMVHSHSFRIEGALDFLKFDMWVNMMLNLNPEGIYRMKGILHIQDFEQKIIFQSVYTQHVCVGGGVWLDDEPKETLLVVIGKNLNREMLQRGLDQLLAK